MLCVTNMAVSVQWLLYGILVDDIYMEVKMGSQDLLPRCNTPMEVVGHTLLVINMLLVWVFASLRGYWHKNFI